MGIFFLCISFLVLPFASSTSPTPLPSRAPTFSPTLEPNFMNTPPPCISNISQLVYINGEISATQSIYKCISNVPDPMMIPTFYNGTYNGVMFVNVSIQLNNLEDIDAVSGTASLDFYLRLVWQDNRLAMPLFWAKMSPYVQKHGIELTELLILNQSAAIWTPDIFFQDATSLDYAVEVWFFCMQMESEWVDIRSCDHCMHCSVL